MISSGRFSSMGTLFGRYCYLGNQVLGFARLIMVYGDTP